MRCWLVHAEQINYDFSHLKFSSDDENLIPAQPVGSHE